MGAIVPTPNLMKEAPDTVIELPDPADPDPAFPTTEKITCPVCGRTSHNPIDVLEGYCGACHAFTTPRDAASNHADGVRFERFIMAAMSVQQTGRKETVELGAAALISLVLAGMFGARMYDMPDLMRVQMLSAASQLAKEFPEPAQQALAAFLPDDDAVNLISLHKGIDPNWPLPTLNGQLMLCPTCPLCGSPPGMVTGGGQAFCTENGCKGLIWRPGVSAQQNLDEARPIDLISQGIITRSDPDPDPTGPAETTAGDKPDPIDIRAPLTPAHDDAQPEQEQ